jgi:uncharacterized membrane protein YkvA (DUF1232 family)
MSELRVTFALSDRDLKHFRQVMRQATAAARGRSEEEIRQAALAKTREVRAAEAPAYVLERIEMLETIINMVEDKDWVLPGSVRPRVLTALAYFLDPVDLIPDHIPGFGFLDDAIMIELIANELRHELSGYRDFCRFRERERQRRHPSSRALEVRLVAKRKQLRGRIQGRQARVQDRAKSERRFRLW